MPFCPQCRSEYRTGFDACKDCGTALVERLPPPHRELPSHDHHVDLVPPQPTTALFPQVQTQSGLPAALSDTAGDEASPEGFLVEGDRAWIYSARTGAEAWFLKLLMGQRGLSCELDYLGNGHPTPFRLLTAKEHGHEAMLALDRLIGTHACPLCEEMGPKIGVDAPFCLACGGKP